jgi:CubicO group peptidase (beta-lactamase class C family)
MRDNTHRRFSMRHAGRLLLFVLVCSLGLRAQSLVPAPVAEQKVDHIDPVLRAQIDRIATQVLQKTGVPSASLAVVQHGKLVYTHAYGFARLEPKTPATPSMRYSIGSISKQFTAAALLMLEEEGKISLDDPVGKYVPGLTGGDKITIRQLLSHTAGYQDYWPEDYAMTPMFKPATSQYILDTWAKKPLDFTPGTQWQYSNTNFVLAGEIIQKVTGHPVTDLLTKRVFQPLGMTTAWNSDQKKLGPADAAAYVRYALGVPRPAPVEGPGWMDAAGELAMTPHDLALWDESLIAQSILKPESYKKMFKEVKLADGKGSGYGLGVEVDSLNGHRVIEHSGEVSGFVSDNVVLVDDGVAVAVLTNQDASSAASSIAHLVAPLVAALPQNPEEKQALAIYRDLQEGKIDRSLLAPNLNDYFSAQTVEDFRSTLGPLGEPLRLTQRKTELRGGMTFRIFAIQYPDRNLTLSTYTYPDGKLEQYIVGQNQ